MKLISQSIPEVILIEPNIIKDNRGYFIETYRQDILDKFLGYKIKFVQDNESKSIKGVLRGLHYQLHSFAQAKLVRVVKGKVLVVAVDIRRKSKTFTNYVAQVICSEKKKQLFIPRGFAHGFIVLSDTAIFNYKVDNFYAPKFERGIAFNDKDLSIDWKIPEKSLIISDKDKKNPSLSSIKDFLE